MNEPVIVNLYQEGEKRVIVLTLFDYLPPSTKIVISLPTFEEIKKAGSWKAAIIENKKIAVGYQIGDEAEGEKDEN